MSSQRIGAVRVRRAATYCRCGLRGTRRSARDAWLMRRATGCTCCAAPHRALRYIYIHSTLYSCCSLPALIASRVGGRTFFVGRRARREGVGRRDALRDALARRAEQLRARLHHVANDLCAQRTGTRWIQSYVYSFESHETSERR